MREKVQAFLLLLPRLTIIKMLSCCILLLGLGLYLYKTIPSKTVTTPHEEKVLGAKIVPTKVAISPTKTLARSISPSPKITSSPTTRPQSNGITSVPSATSQPVTNTPQPTSQPTPTQVISQPSVGLGHLPAKGNSNAKVTIVEYSDFQCPYCKSFYETTFPQIDNEYISSGKVRFVYRHFPLAFHANAEKAAMAAECANEQGKFWEMHNKLFQEQSSWSNAWDPTANFVSYTGGFGFDGDRFLVCLSENRYQGTINDDKSSATINATPTFYVNNQQIVGAMPFEIFKNIIEAELAK